MDREVEMQCCRIYKTLEDGGERSGEIGEQVEGEKKQLEHDCSKSGINACV